MTREEISARCKKWLEDRMADKNWKIADVVRAAKAKGLKGVTKQNISRVLNSTLSKNDTPPTFSQETIVNLAKTFDSSETAALEVIRVMPDDGNSVDLAGKKAADLFVKLPADKQEEAMVYLQHMVDRYGVSKTAKRLKGAAGNARSKKAVKR